jgi:hypothetical protein
MRKLYEIVMVITAAGLAAMVSLIDIPTYSGDPAGFSTPVPMSLWRRRYLSLRRGFSHRAAWPGVVIRRGHARRLSGSACAHLAYHVQGTGHVEESQATGTRQA